MLFIIYRLLYRRFPNNTYSLPLVKEVLFAETHELGYRRVVNTASALL